MNKGKPFLTLLFLLFVVSVYAHKDRIEKPKKCTFIFTGADTVLLDNPTDSTLKIISDEIINHKRQLTVASILFATGETLRFHHDGAKWTTIIISQGKRDISVPDSTVAKIPEIHFETVALLWDGNDKRAFSASYMYIRFAIGTEMSFNKYPELELFFAAHRFSKATVCKQVSENTQQWFSF